MLKEQYCSSHLQYLMTKIPAVIPTNTVTLCVKKQSVLAFLPGAGVAEPCSQEMLRRSIICGSGMSKPLC